MPRHPARRAEAGGREEPADVHPGDADCKAGDQWCADAIIHRPVGGITQDTVHWQKRPAFQHVVEFPGRS